MDAFLSLTYYDENHQDSTFMRIENGKDVYEWTDTSEFINEYSKEGYRNGLRKILQTYTWIPIILLSKGDGAEYTVIPQKFYSYQVDPNLVINMGISLFTKNEGFEVITVPAGTYKAYKVKFTTRVEAYSDTKKLETLDIITYTWISDDHDWWIKRYIPPYRSNYFGFMNYGKIAELISVQ